MLDLAIQVGQKLFKCPAAMGNTKCFLSHLQDGTGLLAKVFKNPSKCIVSNRVLLSTAQHFHFDASKGCEIVVLLSK